MNKHVGGLLIALLLAGGLISMVLAADGGPWAGAEPAVNISKSQDVSEHSALALGDGRVAIAWSGKKTTQDIYLAEKEFDGEWNVQHWPQGEQVTWYPTVAYSGTEPIVAWVQGTTSVPGFVPALNRPRAVMQRDGHGVQAQTIITPMFGDINPDLSIASTGMHMVFVATTISETATQGDIYYTHRNFTQTEWSSPTIVMTRAQAIQSRVQWNSAHIWWPRLAIEENETRLHLTWEQEYRYGTSYTFTIWHMSGTWDAGTITWDIPEQVSPPEQTRAVRPSIAIDEDNVHISWSELYIGTGGLLAPEAQHINYVQIGAEPSIRISGEAIRVNNRQPTWTTSSIAAGGGNVCATWHGFYTGEKEETIMRCSKDGGKTWDALLNVSESQNLLSLFPKVKVDAGDQAHVVWVEFSLVGNSLIPYDLYYRTGTSDVSRIFLPLILRRK